MGLSPRFMLQSGALVVALLGALAGPAGAQDLQNFKPATGTWNLLSVDTADTAPGGRFVPTLWVNWGLNPLVRRDSDGEVIETIIEHYVTTDIVATYGVTEWFEIGLDLPVSYTDGEAIQVIGESGFGLGDLRIVPKVRLPWRLAGVVGLALSVPVSFATGDDSRGMGAGTTQVNPKAIADVRVGGVTATANVGFRYRANDVAVEDLGFGNEVTYGAGLAVELG
ncbi:MAG: transporter, partial [Myxococcales bacterium]|nr:transporter [Myxococcales bacterium]